MLDGDSLALPTALAFLSLWLKQALPADLAATGRLLEQDGVSTVLPVAGVYEKAQALGAIAGNRTRLLAHPEHTSESTAAGATAVEVLTLEQAVTSAGLDLSMAKAPEVGGSTVERVDALRRTTADIDSQHLARYKGIKGEDPWVTMADRLRLLWNSLRDVGGVRAEDLESAQVMASLAYTHAGDLEAAGAMLHNLDVTEETRCPIRVMALIVKIGFGIDHEDWGACSHSSELLDVELEKLNDGERKLLLGRALGTQGRAWMHQRKLDRALPLLNRAVEENLQHSTHEVGRSRVYVAMALRMASKPNEALGQLELAAKELLTHTRAWSEPYYTQCIMFWCYERARVHLDLQQPDHAELCATKALEAASWRGWWPAAGILRTRAWSYRLMGRDDAAVQDMAELERLTATVDSKMGKRFVSEAQGMPRADGEVY